MKSTKQILNTILNKSGRRFLAVILTSIAFALCFASEALAATVQWTGPSSVSVGQTFTIAAYYGSSSLTVYVDEGQSTGSAYRGDYAGEWRAYKAGTVTFFAQYDVGYTSTKVVTIGGGGGGTTTPTLGSVSISLSSSSVAPGDTVSCTLNAYSTNGTSITGGTKSWTISSTTNDSISSSGVVTVAPVQLSRTITVTGKYTYGGVTKSATAKITVTRLPIALAGISLTAPSGPFAPGAQVPVTVEAASVYDGPITNGVASWRVVSEGFGDSVSTNGIVSISSTNFSRVVEIACDYSFGGTTKSATIGLQVQSRCDTPVISPSDGTIFESSLSISMTCGSEGSVIHYTLDGSEPTRESPVYKRFRIYGKTTVKAAAFNDDGQQSDVATAAFALGQCEDPEITSSCGMNFGTAYGCLKSIVSISYGGTEGTLHYTLDGSEPTAESAVYAGEFEISDTTTVKARVLSDNWFDSQVVTATITREWEQVAKPEITAPNSFEGSKAKVVLSCATEGTTICYTLDGNEPNSHSAKYTGPLYVANSCTVKAYALKPDYLVSAVATHEIAKVWGIGDAMGKPDHGFTTDGTRGVGYAIIPWTQGWTEAKADAEARGGHLATITSEEEWNRIWSLFGDAVGGCLLGGTDAENEGVWSWVTGEAWNYTRWETGEPNNGHNEQHYLWIWAGHDGKWDDVAESAGSKYLFESETSNTNITLTATGWMPFADATAPNGEAMKSGAISHNQYSVLETKVMGPGTLTFSWRTSCEDSGGEFDWDHVEFAVDGTVLLKRDGLNSWANESVRIDGEGEHTVSWTYMKDDMEGDGDDAAYVAGYGWISDYTETKTSKVPVPYAWLRQHDPGTVDEYDAYEAAANATAANGRKVWECFLMGLAPMDENSELKLIATVVDDEVQITFEPNLEAERVYVVEGSETLESWGPTNALSQFYRVGVSMP